MVLLYARQLPAKRALGKCTRLVRLAFVGTLRARLAPPRPRLFVVPASPHGTDEATAESRALTLYLSHGNEYVDELIRAQSTATAWNLYEGARATAKHIAYDFYRVFVARAIRLESRSTATVRKEPPVAILVPRFLSSEFSSDFSPPLFPRRLSAAEKALLSSISRINRNVRPYIFARTTAGNFE